MCQMRAGLVKNCRRCKSSIRLNCPIKKQVKKKDYTDNKKRTGSEQKS